LDVVDSEEADRTTSTRLTLNNLGNPNEDIRSLVHLALFNSILDPLHDPAVPFIFLKKGKANPRKGLIKEVRSKALEVCKKAGLEPNCRQVLEYLATQALVDAQNTNDRGDCVGKLGELQTFLIKSKANSDYILESRCHQYISKIKEFIAEADKEEQLAQAQTKEAREKKEKERRDTADSSRGASLAPMEKLSEASRSMTSPSSVKDPAVRDLLFQSLSGSIHHFPSPHAWEDQQLYFLLPDRFSDGNEDSSLDLDGQPVRGSTRPFTPSDSGNAVATPVDARTWEESGTIFQGGTLKGIKSKLGYLKRLGITALWVGPIFKQAPHDNHSYHGYAVQDFLEVDPHFGTGEDLRELVRAAHKEGIYVILDIILNHSGDVFAYKGGGKAWDGRRFDVEGFRDSSGNATLPFRPLSNQDILSNPRDCAIWPAELQMTQTFTCEGAISNWDYEPEYLRGDFHSLKDIDLGSGQLDNFTPSLAFSALCEAYKYWIAYADLDGYRIDTVKHMGDAPTRYLCTTLHEFASSVGKDNFLLVGEVTGGRAFEVVEVTGLDAALGIGNIQEKLWRLPKGYANPAEYFDLFRNATFLKKGTNAWMSNKLVTMIDDHDQVWRGNNQKGRFCSDENGDKLVLAALALNLTSLGIPCIYYGTEQSFDGRGGSDRYIRENMFGGSFGAFRSRNRHFFNESNVIYRECAKICQLRNAHAPLRRGRQYLREISSNGRDFGLPHMIGGRMKSIVAWSRIFADREILCAINTNTESWTNAFVTIDAGLHMMGQILTCIYPGERVDGLNNKTEVIGLNGTAVALSIPPSGFVMYMRIGTVTGSQ
jgi:glycosidase